MKTIDRKDLPYILGFIIYSLLFFVGRWKGVSHFEFLESDIANSTSFAAAQYFPNLFTQDTLLGNIGNVTFYKVIQTPLIHFLYQFTSHFGTATLLLLGPHVFLQLLGFYLLGKEIFQNRFWGLCLAALTSQYIHLTIGDFWGLYYDVLPRFTYQAIFPFLLLLAIKYHNSYKLWPLISFVSGLMMYLHPVSAPTGGFLIWLGFWASLPKQWSKSKSLIYMFITGCCFLLGALPFLWNYLSHHAHGVTLDYETVFEIMIRRFDSDALDIPAGLKNHFFTALQNPIYVLGLISFACLAFINHNLKHTYKILAFWLLGILFTSALVPLVEHQIAIKLKVIPPEIDLIRNLRYSIPLLEVCFLMLLYRLSLQPRLKKLILTLTFAITFFHQGPPEYDPIKDTIVSIKNAKLIPELNDRDKASLFHMEQVRKYIPKNSPVLVTHGIDELAVRYAALLPLVYSYKDGGAFAYSNHKKLLAWFNQTQEFKAAFNAADPLFEFYKFAKKLNAEYMLVGFDMRGEKLINSKAQGHIKIVYENRFPLKDVNSVRTFAIIKVQS